jgi:hypothetical protein
MDAPEMIAEEKNGPYPVVVKNFRQDKRLHNPLFERKRVWDFLAKA